MRGKPICLFDGLFTADVKFEQDISKINEKFNSREDMKMLTLGELLIGFFTFDLSIFDPDLHVISVSHSEGPLIK